MFILSPWSPERVEEEAVTLEGTGSRERRRDWGPAITVKAMCLVTCFLQLEPLQFPELPDSPTSWEPSTQHVVLWEHFMVIRNMGVYVRIDKFQRCSSAGK
jgi:hypothetical protein